MKKRIDELTMALTSWAESLDYDKVIAKLKTTKVETLVAENRAHLYLASLAVNEDVKKLQRYADDGKLCLNGNPFPKQVIKSLSDPDGSVGTVKISDIKRALKIAKEGKLSAGNKVIDRSDSELILTKRESEVQRVNVREDNTALLETIDS